MHHVDRVLFASLILCCSACDLFTKKATPPAPVAAEDPGVALPPVPATSAAADGASGASGSGAMTRRFPVMSTVVPATMPAASAATPAATMGVATGAAGAGAAGGGAEAAAAGAPAVPADANTMMAFDPATFDESMGRSRGTAPPGTPVEAGGMECPNEVCKPLAELPPEAAANGVSIALCCTDQGECGTIGSGPMSMDPPECRLIPDSDPQCARLELMGFEIASCCTADGKCGLNGENFMQEPCGSIEAAMEMFGGFIELPPPAACVPGKGPPLSSSAPAPGQAPAETAGAAGAAGAPAMPAAAGAAAPPSAGSAAP